MPCRDYRDEPEYQQDMQARNDKLARIACKALEHIEKSSDGLEILILKDPEVSEWWSKHKEADRKERERKEYEDNINRIKEKALAKLSLEEKRILGIK